MSIKLGTKVNGEEVELDLISLDGKTVVKDKSFKKQKLKKKDLKKKGLSLEKDELANLGVKK